MKVFVVSSGGPEPEFDERFREFSQKFDDTYAQRFIRHLRDDETLCTGCGDACVHCRRSYKINFTEMIAGQLDLPSRLLQFVDSPEKLLPERLPPHDVIIPINVHQDVMLSLPAMAKAAGASAVVVPVEDPQWLDPWVRGEMRKLCRRLELEFASPKPYCDLVPGSHPAINRFIEEFRIGRPELEITVQEGVIKRARVLRSAPCGNTYFVAHNLRKAPIDEHLHEVVAKYWHSYPCVASMKMDPELGDTILHKGGYIHYEAVDTAMKRAGVVMPEQVGASKKLNLGI